MAIPWSQVQQSPQYQALSPEDQEAARQQYFQQVVAPQVTDPSQLSTVKAQFDAATTAKPTAPTDIRPGDVVVRPDPGQDSFTKGVQEATKQAQAEDAAGPSLGQRIGDAVYQFGTAEAHHLGNAALGLSQLVGHGIQYVANKVLPDDSDLRSQINATAANADRNIAAREAAYQAKVPDSVASYAGAVTGEVAPWLLETPAKGLQTAGNIVSKVAPESLPLLRKIISGATQGGAVAATQPVTAPTAQNDVAGLVRGQPTFAGQKAQQIGLGAVTGGVIPVVGSAVGNIASLATHALNPRAIAAQNIAEKIGATPEVLQQLDNASSSVPGVKPTAAQAAPSPGAVAAEKAAGNTPAFKEALTQRANDNNAARVQAIQNLAGDDAAYAAARAARSNAPLSNGQTVEQFQNALPAASVDPSSVLSTIAKLKNSGLGARPTISNALDQIETAITKRQDANGNIPADVLDSIRQNANDFLTSPSGKQASAQEKAGVMPIKSQIIDALDSAVPGYRDYLATFADKSIPLNTMDAARAILDRADNRPLNSAGAAPLSLADINRGLAQIEKGRYGVSPEAQSILEGIQQSLKQEGISNSIRSPGSDTQYNIAAAKGLPSTLLGPNLEGPTGRARAGAATIGSLIGAHFGGLPGFATGAGLGAFINKGADVINKRIMSEYTKGLLNPEDAATLIRAYLKGNSSNANKLLAKYPQWNALLSTQGARAPQAINQATQPQAATP